MIVGSWTFERLQDLLEHGKECEWLEFKTNFGESDEFGEYISALSNGAALVGEPFGYLVWGIEDQTLKPVGTNFQPSVKRIESQEIDLWLTLHFSEQPVCKFYEIVEGDKRLVVLEIEAARAFPVEFKRQRYLRVDSSKVRANARPQKERALLDALRERSFEDEVAHPSASAQQVLDWLDIPAYFKLSDTPLPSQDEQRLERMVDLRCLRRRAGRYDILNLGAILFAQDLTQFASVRPKALRVVFYRGRNKAAENEELKLGQKGYALILNELLDVLRSRLPSREVSKGAQRISQPDYPESSVRELVVNALVHQDFRSRGSCAMVDIFEDRLEITNPGRPLVDIRRLIDCHPKSRNEQLAGLMRLMRLFEGRGSGIDIVIDRGEERGLPPPEFEVLDPVDGSGAMRAALLAPKSFSEMTPAERIRGVEQHAASQLSKKLRLTNLSLRERFLLDKSQIAQISRLISRAVAEGLIKAAEEDGRSYVPHWA